MGWIKIHRKISNSWLWDEKPFDKARAWIDLILLAKYQDEKLVLDEKEILINRGSFMTSTLKLSTRWGWSRNKVIRFLERLENEDMITINSYRCGTVISIVKYEDYQCENTYDDKKSTKESKAKNNSKKIETEENEKNFKTIYDSYPKKVGKAKGYEYYLQWLKGRDISGRKIKLTNKQIWIAIAKYKIQQEENNTELQFYKNFDVFMNKAILDYVEDEEC